MKITGVLVLISCLMSCSSSNTIFEDSQDINDLINNNTPLKILSLGDSYTIGESVCNNCKFPSQLKDSLSRRTGNFTISLEVIARTGWTTTNLISAIKTRALSNDFDLVTLLIGVNNQYQKKDFTIYETEFPELVKIAINKAGNNKDKVIVLSIPDYTFTPFGNADTAISKEIDKFNKFAEDYCDANGITFINITDITRQGLANPNYVAQDGLHPSEEAYTKFVERLLPVALEKIE